MRSPLLFALFVAACAPLETDPSRAVVVADDVPLFWDAFDRGTDAATLQQHYLDRGTRYLKQFAEGRISSASRLSETVTRNRNYYESIRANTLSVTTPEWRASLGETFARAEALDPATVFPPTVLLIGRMNSGGTTSREAILIGLELFTMAPDSPKDTLNAFERVAAQPVEGLVPLIAHELVHIQQTEHGSLMVDQTLLARSLREGIADCIGEKTAGRLLNVPLYAWGEAHEAEVWQEFRAEMNGTVVDRWLYNQGQDPDRPGDLGYFVGARIAKAWVKRQPDEAEALRALLRVTDARKLLEESGYDGTAP